MKKTLSLILAAMLLVGCVFVLASCSNVTEAYADKINEAADNKEYLAYEDVLKDLGDEAVDYTGELFGVRGGFIVAIKGCTTKDEIKQKVESSDKVEGIYILIVNGNATKAYYKEITEDDIKD